jgi:hypothetical protein
MFKRMKVRCCLSLVAPSSSCGWRWLGACRREFRRGCLCGAENWTARCVPAFNGGRLAWAAARNHGTVGRGMATADRTARKSAQAMGGGGGGGGLTLATYPLQPLPGRRNRYEYASASHMAMPCALQQQQELRGGGVGQWGCGRRIIDVADDVSLTPVCACARFTITALFACDLCLWVCALVLFQQSWRKPHGMDGRQRRRFKGTQLHVKVGYGNNKKTRFMMPDGFLKFRVSNVKELELLLMHNKKYAAGEPHANSYTRTHTHVHTHWRRWWCWEMKVEEEWRLLRIADGGGGRREGVREDRWRVARGRICQWGGSGTRIASCAFVFLRGRHVREGKGRCSAHV